MKIFRGSHVVKALLIGGAFVAGTAEAQITRGFIAPHEYSLPDPVDMKPWNVFVEYATYQETERAYDSHGDRVRSDKVDQLVGLSKFVHFFNIAPTVGIGWEIIVPEVGVRNRTADSSVSGIGDPITGPAFWIRPNENWTLGADIFTQVPVGDDKLRGTRWNTIGSAFWDAQYGNVNYTGNLGYQFPGAADRAGGARPGPNYYFNNRFGYRVTPLIEPYVGLDYEYYQSRRDVPKNHELAGAAGVMFHWLKNSSLAVHYQGGLTGESRAKSNNVNLRFVYVF